MAVTRRYRLNLRNYGNLPAIMLSQYDEGYALVFDIYDGVNPSASLSAYTVKLKGVRYDGLAYEFTGTTTGESGNILSFVIDTTMSACPGKGTAEIAIIDSSNDVLFATFNMPVFVERAAVPEGSIDADVERALEIAEQVQEIVDNAAAAVSGEAEKWATGQIDGTDVPSTDPAYENNAKYYAEQAEIAAASIGIDATLTQAGKAADAKKTGDEISQLKSDLNAFVCSNYVDPQITGWIDGGYISRTDGSVVEYSSYHYTDYIEINPLLGGIKFTNSGGSFDVVYNAWYDENKAFIKSFSTKKGDSIVIQPPLNARYMRLSFNKTTTNTISAEYIYGSILGNSAWNGLTNYLRSKFLFDWYHVGDGTYNIGNDSRTTIINPLHFDFDINVLANSGYNVAAQFFDGYETGSSHLQSSTGWLDTISIPKGSYFCLTFRASDNSTLTNTSIENLSAVGYANNSDIYAKLMPMFDKYIGEPTDLTDYLLDTGFDKKYFELSPLGSISGGQSFCIYNDKFYSTNGSNLFEQGSDLSLISATALSLGHGNALQLGHNGKAYASGWNDNNVYVVDLENKEITDTIALPVTGYTTCAIDDINELIYVFHRASYPDTVATYTLTVYDYANDEVIRTSKISRQFAAMQGCDFIDGKIFVMYGLGTSSAPNGYVIFDTNGNILAEYIIASKSTLEPEGICVDRSTNDIYISYVNRNLYKINFV